MKDAQKLQNIVDKAYKMRIKEHVRNGHKEYDIEMLYPGSNNFCYYVKNGICTFEYKDQVYVIPVLIDGINVKEVFDQIGFMERPMYVPFANGEKPVDRSDEFNVIFCKNTAAVRAYNAAM